ncbi:hypothetical protein ACT3SP_06520 [Brachybacterium sp. AOP43-C2-M15]|uniref:hypothetical protein n=1 Tax=Brachybacterium sp. AOP43-C2-M15 TaxID=3457661 RepID=UPI0040338492
MISTPDTASTASDGDLPTRTYGPPATVVVGTLVVALIFLVVLEFLVIISFIGQRLWRHPEMMHDLVFTLPLIVWAAMAALVTVVCLRVITSWLQIHETGFELRSLFRRTRAARWDEVGTVIAVRDIDRGYTPAEMLDASETAYDGVYVMDRSGRRILAVSSRFFGSRAQEMALQRAREAGVGIEHIDAITPVELRRQVPQAMSFVDRHPNLLLVALLAFYLGHNLLTFIVWGL